MRACGPQFNNRNRILPWLPHSQLLHPRPSTPRPMGSTRGYRNSRPSLEWWLLTDHRFFGTLFGLLHKFAAMPVEGENSVWLHNSLFKADKASLLRSNGKLFRCQGSPSVTCIPWISKQYRTKLSHDLDAHPQIWKVWNQLGSANTWTRKLKGNRSEAISFWSSKYGKPTSNER